MKFKRSDLIDCVQYALDEAAETNGKFARDVAGTVIDYVIKALRADRSIPARALTQWEDFFADAARDAADDLPRLDRLISPEQAIWAIEDFFFDLDRSTNDKPSAPQASAGTE
jgi:hypothetical protein